MRQIIAVFLSLSMLGCAAGIAPADPPAPTGPRISLSYDDAPRGDGPMFTGPERAEALIDALAETETVAVFFVTTQGFRKPEGRERIAKYAAAGHLIANHSDTHPWASKVPVDEYLAGVRTAQEKLNGIENLRPWFRFPYLDEGRPLARRDALRAGLEEMGLINGYVTIDNYDWYLQSEWENALREGRSVNMDALRKVYLDMMLDAAAYFEKIAVEDLGTSPAHTLLLHENDLAALFADDLVVALREAGWEIVDPDTAYEDPIADQIPETLFGNMGRVAALATDKGRSPRTFTNWGTFEDQIDARLEAAGAFGPPPEGGVVTP